jgi:hypothetical protein
MSTQDEQFSNICDEIRLIQRRIAELSVTPDRSSAHQIKELICPGEGLLAKLRPPPVSRSNQRTRRRPAKNREDSGEEEDDDDEVGSDSDSDTSTDGSLDEEVLDDPSSKGKLGEEKALEYLRSLENIIVSPLLPVGGRPISDANGFPNHRQKNSRFRQWKLLLHSVLTSSHSPTNSRLQLSA